ncbi:MAG: peptide chain release factor N(5)-glutamine methyltransferase [Bacteroidales bacterium]
MRIKDNQLNSILTFFTEELKNLYPYAESESLFYWAAEELLSKSRMELKSKLQERINESDLLLFFEVVKRLHKGEPIQYIFEKAYFSDLILKVNSQVLIPRPETEELLFWTIKGKKQTNINLKILDLCTGSGCLAIALAKQFPMAEVHAVDFSTTALQIAQENAINNQTKILFQQANLLQDKLQIAPTKNYFHLIVSNPPYVRESEKKYIRPNVLHFEPELALFVKDEDPLIFYDALAQIAMQELQIGGDIFVEINENLAKETLQIFQDHGLDNCELKKDLNDKWRMLHGQKKDRS